MYYIGKGVTYISNRTFNSCGIEYLYLPASLEEFKGWNYFHNLQILYYGGSEEQLGEICNLDDPIIDIEQIICNANTNGLIVPKIIE